MINQKIIFRILGFLLYIEALMLLFCSAFGFYYHEDDNVAFTIAGGISILVGGLFSYLGRPQLQQHSS